MQIVGPRHSRPSRRPHLERRPLAPRSRRRARPRSATRRPRRRHRHRHGDSVPVWRTRRPAPARQWTPRRGWSAQRKRPWRPSRATVRPRGMPGVETAAPRRRRPCLVAVLPASTYGRRLASTTVQLTGVHLADLCTNNRGVSSGRGGEFDGKQNVVDGGQKIIQRGLN